MRIYELAQQLLRCLFSGVDFRFKELRSAADIALNSGIFFLRHQVFGKVIGENRMFFIFCMKCPSERTHQGGNTGFVIHFVGSLPPVNITLVQLPEATGLCSPYFRNTQAAPEASFYRNW